VSIPISFSVGPCPAGGSRCLTAAVKCGDSTVCALLAPPVDGDLRRVQIDRHRLARITAQRLVEARPGASYRALDALHMTAPEALCVLQRRRRRRSARHVPQPGPGAIGAHILDVIDERAAEGNEDARRHAAAASDGGGGSEHPVTSRRR
jgi:hypothetical protein